MVDLKRHSDEQPTRCLFQKTKECGEWETYLTVGEYPLAELKKILYVLCSPRFDEIFNGCKRNIND